jgi:adenylate kinase
VKNPQTVIFIGRSGCGKGTQAGLFKDWLHKQDKDKQQILYVETGVKFRHFIEGDSFSSKLSKYDYETDKRQPDFLACLMWGNMLVEELEENMHLVFDGAPRSLPEAELITTAFEFYKRNKPTIIHLDVSREWSEERLLARGRLDDKTLSKIMKRLNWFDADVSPAIEYFKKTPLYNYIRINGEQPIEKVFKDILENYDKA